MSAGIKPGDLVMVVRGNPCCGKSKFMGIPFTVIDDPIFSNTQCSSCGAVRPNEKDAVALDGYSNGLPIAISQSQLLKIDPLAQGDSLPTWAELNIKEPA